MPTTAHIHYHAPELRAPRERPLVVTRTGIRIGGAYLAPPPRPGSHAEDVQAAFLPTPIGQLAPHEAAVPLTRGERAATWAAAAGALAVAITLILATQGPLP